VVQEPLSRWTNIQSDEDQVTNSQKNGGNLLEMFYTDTTRWAYTCKSVSRIMLKFVRFTLRRAFRL
jgi:deoxycitidine kinase